MACGLHSNPASMPNQSRIRSTWPLADSQGTELTRLLGNSRLALPYTVVLGPCGEAQMTRLGRVSESELDELLRKVAVR